MVGILSSVISEHREKKLEEAKKIYLTSTVDDKFVVGKNIFLLRMKITELITKADNAVRKIFDRLTDYQEFHVDTTESRTTSTESFLSNLNFLKDKEKEKPKTKTIGIRPSALNYDTQELTDTTKSAIQDLFQMKQNLLKSTQDLKYQSFHDFIYIWILILIGTFSMQVIENWRLNDAYYFSVVTITTVGYGDIVPTTKEGKIFTIFYILIGTGLMAKTLGNLIMVSYILKIKFIFIFLI